MIVEMTSEDYASLCLGRAPGQYDNADSPIAPLEVLRMLEDVAARVRETFSPASWLIVENNEIVGMCSVTRQPADGVIEIGYGIAPTRQNRGIAGRAIGDIVAWARTSPDVQTINAETGIANLASQRVLERNGFARVGERVDEEDGPLICWRCSTG